MGYSRVLKRFVVCVILFLFFSGCSCKNDESELNTKPITNNPYNRMGFN